MPELYPGTPDPMSEEPHKVVQDVRTDTVASVGSEAVRDPNTAAVDRILSQARAGLDRVAVADLAAEVAAGALVVDTRPVEQRSRDGALPGALVVDRNVLEWRLDPTCPDRIPEATDAARRIILVCNEGFSSSLAAASLQRLGLSRATDLIGGFQEWACASSQQDGPAPRGIDGI
jgi:rhodanese-related sulfurtransferase